MSGQVKKFTPVALHKGFGYESSQKLLERPKPQIEGVSAPSTGGFVESRFETLSTTPKFNSITVNKGINSKPSLQPLEMPEAPSRTIYKKPSDLLQIKAELLNEDVESPEVSVVTRARALAAWVLDGLIAFSVLVFSAGLVYAAGESPFMRKVSAYINSKIGSGMEDDILLLNWIAEVAIVSAVLLFLFQFVTTFICGGSAGRSALGIYIRRGKLTAFSNFAIAVSEVITLGGLLSLPMVLVAPGRIPVFPFLKLTREQ